MKTVSQPAPLYYIEERVDYLDALRTIACFTVVMLHVASGNTYYVEFRSHEWNVFMLYESVVNWAVPMFAMISGALMLGKEYEYKRILAKCNSIAFIFFAWSFAFLVFDFFVYGPETYQNGLWLQVLLQGHYHLWYLIMLFGLYLIVPLVKAMTDKPQLLKAFVILSCIFTFLVPTINNLPYVSRLGTALKNPIAGAIFQAFHNVAEDLNFHLTKGFAAYYVIGYVLVRFSRLPKRGGMLFGALMCLSGFFVEFLVIHFAVSKEAARLFMKHDQIGILMQACGMMIFVKALSGKKILGFLAGISPLTLGIYICHPMLIELLKHIGITSLSFRPFFSIPILSCCVFVLAGLMTRLILLTPAKNLVCISGGKRKEQSK